MSEMCVQMRRCGSLPTEPDDRCRHLDGVLETSPAAKHKVYGEVAAAPCEQRRSRVAQRPS